MAAIPAPSVALFPPSRSSAPCRGGSAADFRRGMAAASRHRVSARASRFPVPAQRRSTVLRVQIPPHPRIASADSRRRFVENHEVSSADVRRSGGFVLQRRRHPEQPSRPPRLQRDAPVVGHASRPPDLASIPGGSTNRWRRRSALRTKLRKARDSASMNRSWHFDGCSSIRRWRRIRPGSRSGPTTTWRLGLPPARPAAGSGSMAATSRACQHLEPNRNGRSSTVRRRRSSSA